MNSEEGKPGIGSDVAIVGIAGRFPGAQDVGQFWRNLAAGRESIVPVSDDDLRASGVAEDLLGNPHYVKASAPLDEMESFDAGFFGFSPREASILDPQHRHFLECCWLALEDAGFPPGSFPGPIGVFGGSGHNAYLPYNLLTNPELVRSVGLFLLRHTGNDKDFLTTRVSYLLNLTGPSVNVQTACSTSLVAVHLACQSLLLGECDMALAGGVTLELPHRQGYVYEDGEILSPDGHCRAFDATSQGTVFGSGVGVVVLRRLSDAIAAGDHIHAVVKGSAVNNDGALKVGYLAPSVDGQAQAIAEALAVANVNADSISYVEAHGTGTPVGDPIEVAALTQAFRRTTSRRGFCGLGSLKTNIGHLDTAAGIASLMKVVLALQHEQLPPTLHFTSPNPACDFENSPFFVQAQSSPWPRSGVPRRAGVSSLGVGGTNAHVIVEEAPLRTASRYTRSAQLIVQSARKPDALDRGTRRLVDHLEAHPDLPLGDVSYTLRVGRQAMKHRRITVASSIADLTEALDAGAAPRVLTQAVSDTNRPVAFMFAGGGAQYPNMGADLYRGEAAFKDIVDRCFAILEGNGGPNLRAALYPPPGDEAAAARQLERPSIGLPALFITQYAQARLWMSWGVRPDAMIGHSMGEYTAACLAGVLSLEDALALVSLRGQLFERVPEGAMLSVPLAAADLQPHLPPELSIAAINSPANCVASGPAAAIEALQKRLADLDIDSIRIRIAVAAHSAMLEPVLTEFERFFERIALHPLQTPIVSNLSGTWLTDEEATDPRYWVRHLRQTVQFSDGVRELVSHPSRVLLEVGPGRTLASLARMQPSDAPRTVLSSLRHPDEAGSDVEFVLTVLGKLWLAGVDIDWTGFDADQSPRRTPLPGYAFDRQRHWVEPGRTVPAGDGTATAPVKRADVGQWTYQPVWHRAVTRPSAPLPGRVLVLADATESGDAVVERLVADGAAVVTVHPGRDYARTSPTTFVVDPASPEHFGLVLDALAADGAVPDAVVHLWTLTPAADDRPDAAFRPMEDRAFFSLLHLAQAIGRADIASPLQLLVVSDHLQRVGAEPAPMAAKAMLLGPVRVIPREYPNVSCRSLDVSVAGDPAGRRSLAGAVVDELRRPGDEPVVARRGPERWVEAFAPVALPADTSADHPSGGATLITGGYGGIGLEVAAHLASTRRTPLVLVGRHGLPDRDAWTAWRAAHGAEDRTSQLIGRVEQMETAGAVVLPLVGDVTRPDDMRAVVAATLARFGAIDTVVHAAGVLEDGLIELKDRAAVARVVAPKIAGLHALDDALAGVPVERVVLFSSTSAIVGLPGQIDYAAANAFLDAYAAERVAREGRRVVSVNWSAWRDVGMAAALAGGHGGGLEAPQTTGHPLVMQRLSGTAGRSDFQTTFETRSHWLLDEHRIKNGHALIPGSGFLEIARAAVAMHTGATAFEFTDVAFSSPFVVHDDAPRALRVVVTHTPAGTEFVIASPASADGDTWHEHARGVVAATPEPRRDAVDLDAIARRCAVRERIVSEPETREHLVFGPRWNNVTRIRFGDADALLTLRLPDEFVDDLLTCALHPAMVDMAMAGAQELIPGFDEHQDFFVPLSYGAVRIHAPLPQNVLSHVTYRERESSAGQFAVFDVTIYDELGHLLAELEEFTMVRVKDRNRLTGDGVPPAVPLAELAPPPRASRPPIDLSNGISTAEGLTVFDRILESGITGQVIVSPLDLDAVIARARAPVTPVARERAAPAQPAGPDLSPVTAALLTHPAVGDATAIAWTDTSGELRVVAYVVYDADNQATVSELRKHLRAAVAADLVPHTFIDLDQLPRLADGSVNRGALENPFGVVEQVALPETATETLIADLWKDLLGIGTVGVHDNFFDIGGHSLLSMRLIARLDKKTGVRLQHEHVVVNTLRQLAAKCDQMLTGQAPAGVGTSGASGQTSLGRGR